MKISFFAPIVNTNQKPNNPCFGNIVESYFDIGQKRYSITKITGKTIEVKQEDGKRHSTLITALKIASYLTILLPLIMLALKCVYRLNNRFVEKSNPVVRSVPMFMYNDSNINYDYGEHIARMQACKTAGKKLCLFVGRTDCEPLPDDGDDTVWVSLDNRTSGQIPSDRIHLCADFNNYRGFIALQGFFDTIVVDYSVWKFAQNDLGFNRTKNTYIRSPIEHFHSLLKPGSNSKFIFESSYTIGTDPNGSVNPQPTYYDNTVLVGPREMLNVSTHSQIRQEAMQRTTAKLRTLFHSVIYHPKTDYPYQYRNPPFQAEYFEAIGPK